VKLRIIHDGGEHELLVVPAQAKEPLSELLRRAGVPLNTRCGGRGLCDACQVVLSAGRLRHIETGEATSAVDMPGSLRACQHRCDGDVTIVVPTRSSLRYVPKIETDYRINISSTFSPLYTAKNGQACLGVAVDIGTTTVVLMLVDLHDGKVLARAAAFNEQMHLGDDVVTRINLCMTDPTMLGQMQHRVADQTIGVLLTKALADAHANVADVKCIALAGNTTMLHLLAGVDPSSLGVSPFTAVFLDHRIEPASRIFDKSSNVPGDTPCHLLPGASAYVGADLTVGIVATGLLYDDGPNLLVDVGTNGEIILKHGNRLLGCATAAGPAFEGARLTSGMRAGGGAVSHIKITREPFDLEVEVIGNAKPAGMCGSAYVDFLAEARAAGIITPTGRYDLENLPPQIAAKLIPLKTDCGPDMGLKIAGTTAQPVMVSQQDIARLLQAKAAIAAGILTLLAHAKLNPADIKTVYLAGGFGTHMSRAAAIACGLLPDFTLDQIQVVGNTALAGAYLALIDSTLLPDITRAAKEMDVVELNLDPEFESRYIDQLSLP